MTIDALPPFPDPINDADTVFDAKAQAWGLALALWTNQANSLAAAMNLNATTDTSATSNTLGTGAKSFTVAAGKSFQGGMYLVIADTAAPSTNSMLAQVTSYSGTTLVVNVLNYVGSGTKTAWTISQSMLTSSITGDHEVTVHTGNGCGSTNTFVRRYSTTQRSVGTAITYADSATAGASFTINEDGRYEVYTAEEHTTTTALPFGASLNSANLTTALQNISATERVLMSSFTSGTGVVAPSASRTLRLLAGDVIRPHNGVGALAGTTTGRAIFSIRKVGL